MIRRYTGRNRLFDTPSDPVLQNIPIIPHHTGGHTKHVTVHRWDGNIKSDGGNRPCGIASDTRKGQQLLKVFRDFSPMLFHYHAGGLLEIAHTAVIPQSFPQFQDLILGCFRQSLHRR